MPINAGNIPAWLIPSETPTEALLKGAQVGNMIATSRYRNQALQEEARRADQAAMLKAQENELQTKQLDSQIASRSIMNQAAMTKMERDQEDMVNMVDLVKQISESDDPASVDRKSFWDDGKQRIAETLISNKLVEKQKARVLEGTSNHASILSKNPDLTDPNVAIQIYENAENYGLPMAVIEHFESLRQRAEKIAELKSAEEEKIRKSKEPISPSTVTTLYTEEGKPIAYEINSDKGTPHRIDIPEISKEGASRIYSYEKQKSKLQSDMIEERIKEEPNSKKLEKMTNELASVQRTIDGLRKGSASAGSSQAPTKVGLDGKIVK